MRFRSAACGCGMWAAAQRNIIYILPEVVHMMILLPSGLETGRADALHRRRLQQYRAVRSSPNGERGGAERSYEVYTLQETA